MNTPAHVVLNLLVLDRERRPARGLPILLGALLPDLPMLFFYAWEKLVRAVPERVIWSESYYDPFWQAWIDLFNSLPLIALAGIVAVGLRDRRAQAFLASMALHVLMDLPLHHDDAHRHFFPFSDWRFESPVSYWDPRHYGGLAAPTEALMVLAGCLLLARRHPGRGIRIPLALLALLYLAYLGFALWMWS